MNASEIIRTVIRCSGFDQSGCARKLGWSRQKMSNKLIKNTFTADEFLALLDILGMELQIKMKDDVAEPKVKKQVEPEIKLAESKYDPAKASVVNTTFYLDGQNKYTNGKAEELSVMCDEETGELFFYITTYFEQKRKREITRAVSRAEADAFILRSKPINEIRKVKK